MAELRATVEQCEGELRALKKEAATKQAGGGALRRAQATAEADLAALDARRSDILEAASMEQVCSACGHCLQLPNMFV